METVPERLNLPPREPQGVGPSVAEGVEPERQMEVGMSDAGAPGGGGEGGGAEELTTVEGGGGGGEGGGGEGEGEGVVHNVAEGEHVELNVQVDEVRTEDIAHI